MTIQLNAPYGISQCLLHIASQCIRVKTQQHICLTIIKYLVYGFTIPSAVMELDIGRISGHNSHVQSEAKPLTVEKINVCITEY